MGQLLPLTDPRYVEDPHPFWAHLRVEDPVHFDEELGFWALSRYDDVLSAAKDSATFSSLIGPGGPMMGRDPGEGHFLPMIQNDPPDHTRLRTNLSRAFTPRRVAEMEPRIREIADGLISEIERKASKDEPLDLYDDLASPLPVVVIAEILGVPESMRERLRLWAGVTGIGTGEGFPLERRFEIFGEFDRYLSDLVEERRQEPGDDMISALIHVSEAEGGQLRPDELVRLCELLWIAGNETTTNLISNAALVLQERPELLADLVANPGLVPAFVEESLRYCSPVSGLFRVASRDVEVRGKKIREGEAVWLMFSSANRDTDHFDRPDEFDIRRKPNDHLAFGFGIHFCLGAALARLEAKVAFESMLSILPLVRLDATHGERVPTPILRGWLKLPMTLSPKVKPT